MRPSCADQRLATAAVALVVIASGAMAGCDTHRNDSGLISVPGGRLWGARFDLTVDQVPHRNSVVLDEHHGGVSLWVHRG